MLTQCPHCLTLFRIKPDHLKVAAGKVRCCQCNSVFNALQSLQESPATFTRQESALLYREPNTEAAEGHKESKTENPSREPDSVAAPNDEIDSEPLDEDSGGFEDSDLSPSSSPQGMGDEIHTDIFEQNDGLETEPDYFAAGTESQMSELLDQDSVSSLLLAEHTAEEKDLKNAAEVLDFSPLKETESEPIAWPSEAVFRDSLLSQENPGKGSRPSDHDAEPTFRSPGEAPPREPATGGGLDERVYIFEAFEEQKHPARRPKRLPWILGSLLLLIVLGVQLAWQWRENLVQYDTGRQLLSGLCRIAGCAVPILRATNKIIIQGRNLTSHPDRPAALLLQLRMVNTATFEQPFPQLQLTLYNDKGRLIARRTFKPEDYLPVELRNDPLPLMPKGDPVLVEMELQDPGKEVTGFTFDFR